MLESTPSDGLRRYQIGAKLRALRLRRKLGLVVLGNQTGLSPAMLSKIERGRLFPTLPTLLRIAQVFGVGLDHFFSGVESAPMLAIVRRQERAGGANPAAGRQASIHIEPFAFPVADRRLTAAYLEVEGATAEQRERHSHSGVEFVFVLTGTLAVVFDHGDHVLETGDAIYFDSGHPHGYARRGSDRCAALVVTAD